MRPFLTVMLCAAFVIACATTVSAGDPVQKTQVQKTPVQKQAPTQKTVLVEDECVAPSCFFRVRHVIRPTLFGHGYVERIRVVPRWHVHRFRVRTTVTCCPGGCCR